MKIIVHDGMATVWKLMEGVNFGNQFRLFFQEQMNSPDVNIWCWEGKNSRKVRTELYPPYKSKRPPLKQNIQTGKEFFRELLSHTSSLQISVEEREADDVIAKVCHSYCSSGVPIQINSRDEDLRVLEALNNVTLNNRNKKILVTEPKLIPYYKTWVGDSADCISGVPRFGPKAWEKSNIPQLIDITGRIVNHQTWRLDELIQAGVSETHSLWVRDNPSEFKSLFRVVQFLPVSDDQLESGTLQGKPDQQKLSNLLQEFFL